MDTGMESLLIGCCLYISGQFEVVERQIFGLDCEFFVFKAKLTEIIKQHNLCINLTGQMVIIFSEIVLTQFISASCVVAMTSFNMLITSGSDRLTYLCYLLAAVVQMYFFCKNGTNLADSVSAPGKSIRNNYQRVWISFRAQGYPLLLTTFSGMNMTGPSKS
jgi:odorant receptor